MFEIRSYRDLFAWQRAMELARLSYLVAKLFPREELYELSSQLRRAAVSVPANIAEGHARNHRKEFIQFLGIAKGSLAELQTLLTLSVNLGLVSASDIASAYLKSEEVEKILSSLVLSLAPNP